MCFWNIKLYFIVNGLNFARDYMDNINNDYKFVLILYIWKKNMISLAYVEFEIFCEEKFNLFTTDCLKRLPYI